MAGQSFQDESKATANVSIGRLQFRCLFCERVWITTLSVLQSMLKVCLADVDNHLSRRSKRSPTRLVTVESRAFWRRTWSPLNYLGHRLVAFFIPVAMRWRLRRNASHQNQIRDQHNGCYARYRKHQGLPRFAVTGKPHDLHSQCPIWWLP